MYNPRNRVRLKYKQIELLLQTIFLIFLLAIRSKTLYNKVSHQGLNLFIRC